MSITTLSGYKAAKKQPLRGWKQTFTGFSGLWRNASGTGNNPGNTTSGVLLTDADALSLGPIQTFEAGTTGYVSGIDFRLGSTQSQVAMLVDRIWHAGMFTFNANATLTGQPSIAGRVPNGDYKEVQLWIECGTTAPTGVFNIEIGYTNQNGVAGRTTGVVALSTFGATSNSAITMYRMPLQQGDTGVQSVQTVVGTVATAGTFNVVLLRQIAVFGTLTGAGEPPAYERMGGDLVKVGMPIIYDDSCLFLMLRNNSGGGAASFDIITEIASG